MRLDKVVLMYFFHFEYLLYVLLDKPLGRCYTTNIQDDPAKDPSSPFDTEQDIVDNCFLAGE